MFLDIGYAGEEGAVLPVMFWLYGGGFIMGDASEENYLPGPLLDTQQVECLSLSFVHVFHKLCVQEVVTNFMQ